MPGLTAAQQAFRDEHERQKQQSRQKNDDLANSIKDALTKANMQQARRNADSWYQNQQLAAQRDTVKGQSLARDLQQTAQGLQPRGYDTFVSAILDIVAVALALSKVIHHSAIKVNVNRFMNYTEFKARQGLLSKEIFNKAKGLDIAVSSHIDDKGRLNVDFTAKDSNFKLTDEHKKVLKEQVEAYLQAAGYTKQADNSWLDNAKSPLTQDKFDELQKEQMAIEQWIEDLMNSPENKFDIAVKHLSSFFIPAEPEPDPKPRP